VLHSGEPVLGVLGEYLARFPDVAGSVRLVPRGEVRTDASAVLTSSGTMSLSLTLAGVPGAVVYRASPLTWLVGRRLVKGVRYLGIANILLTPRVAGVFAGRCDTHRAGGAPAALGGEAMHGAGAQLFPRRHEDFFKKCLSKRNLSAPCLSVSVTTHRFSTTQP
jgi:hypothetical protein